MPALSIQPVQCVPTCLPQPEDYDLVVFVSGTAVLLYCQQLARIRPGQAWPTHTLVATVGRASAELLYKTRSIPASHILHSDADAASHDSEALWEVLAPRLP